LWSTFQWSVARIDYSHPWKVLPSKSAFHLLFLVTKSSFGEHKIAQFRTHYLTKDTACVSTQSSGNLKSVHAIPCWKSVVKCESNCRVPNSIAHTLVTWW
jgi:hypothetical protein